jgi:hypothetical protein
MPITSEVDRTLTEFLSGDNSGFFGGGSGLLWTPGESVNDSTPFLWFLLFRFCLKGTPLLPFSLFSLSVEFSSEVESIMSEPLEPSSISDLVFFTLSKDSLNTGRSRGVSVALDGTSTFLVWSLLTKSRPLGFRGGGGFLIAVTLGEFVEEFGDSHSGNGGFFTAVTLGEFGEEFGEELGDLPFSTPARTLLALAFSCSDTSLPLCSDLSHDLTPGEPGLGDACGFAGGVGGPALGSRGEELGLVGGAGFPCCGGNFRFTLGESFLIAGGEPFCFTGNRAPEEGFNLTSPKALASSLRWSTLPASDIPQEYELHKIVCWLVGGEWLVVSNCHTSS